MVINIDQSTHHWSTLIDTDRHWSTLIDTDRHWSTLIDNDRHRSTLIDTDQHWSTLIDTDRHWLTLIDTDWHWSTLIDNDRHRSTVANLPTMIWACSCPSFCRRSRLRPSSRGWAWQIRILLPRRSTRKRQSGSARTGIVRKECLENHRKVKIAAPTNSYVNFDIAGCQNVDFLTPIHIIHPAWKLWHWFNKIRFLYIGWVRMGNVSVNVNVSVNKCK
jgi:hypothetical protein